MCWNLLCLLSKAWSSSSSSVFQNEGKTWRRITRRFFLFCFPFAKLKVIYASVMQNASPGVMMSPRDCVVGLSRCVFTQTVRVFVTLRFFAGQRHISESSCGCMFEKMNSLQMSQVPSSHRAPLGVSLLRGLTMRDKRHVPHNESSLSAVLTLIKEKTESVSLMTLAVPYIVPPHHHCHNDTLVIFLCPWLSALFGGFGGDRGSAVLSLQRQQPSKQDGLSGSFSAVFCHVKHWACCVLTSMQMTLLVAIAQPWDCFFFPWLNLGTMSRAAVKVQPQHGCFLDVSKTWTVQFVKARTADTTGIPPLIHLLEKYFNTLQNLLSISASKDQNIF